LEQNGQVYYIADKGVAGCLDLKSGKASWTQRLAGNFTSSPLLVDGKVIGLNEDGELFVFTASPKMYENIGRLKLGEGVLASPALADGKLYVRGHDHLFCLGATK
jgi:outer membrane protein assembly factor BamB